MQIDVTDSTVQQFAKWVKAQGLSGVSASEAIDHFLQAVAKAPAEVTMAEIAQSIGTNGEAKTSESAKEMAERLGLIGALPDGPPDLSSNSDHMNGFGE
ncbi:MAG: hypothetical protein AAGD07_19385 [Planctomycetota bacterium]